MSPASFTAKNTKGHVIGYRPFVTAMEGLEREGLVERVRGTIDPTKLAFEKGIATRFRATAKFIDFAEEYGVRLADWSSHFDVRPRPAVNDVPVQLRADRRTDKKGRKLKGESMTVDQSHPSVIIATRQVNDINAFIATQDIQPAEWHGTFTRIYAQGDLPEFNWNKGARVYSRTDTENYQRVPRKERKRIRINGEATVEVDIRASYLTILHHLMGVPMIGDPYGIPGVPRLVVKIWMTITLGHDRFHRGWGDAAKERYAESDDFKGRDLQKDYSFGKTQTRILEHLPLLRDWPDNPVTWADLQYLESQAVVDAVHKLAMEQQVPALPLHDALIVPRSKAEQAKQVLSDCFLRHVGVRPEITIKDHGL